VSWNDEERFAQKDNFHRLLKNALMQGFPAFAEAPALRKASGCGATRRRRRKRITPQMGVFEQPGG